MIKKRNKIFFTMISFLSLMAISFNALCACTGDPNDPGFPDNPDDPPCDAPLDTWVFLLVFLVLALTAWYYYKQKKSLRTL